MSQSLLSLALPRPVYRPPAHMDREFEKLMRDHCRKRGESLDHPVSTDAIETLIESRCREFQPYDTDLEDGVEGVTEFNRGSRPTVRISHRLKRVQRPQRYRSTLAHEFGHVVLHDQLFQDLDPGLGFASAVAVSRDIEKNSEINDRHEAWMESQAWYACGALLMPLTVLQGIVRIECEACEQFGPIWMLGEFGQGLIRVCSDRFEVSQDLARIRLIKTRALTESPPPRGLFS